MLIDYHVHTEFSNDCNVPMREQCQAAIRNGVRQIAFTEHEENNPKEYLPFSFDHPAYLAELARCRQEFGERLTIRAAIEISEPHRYADAAERVLSRHPWDFVLGSLHWLTADVNVISKEFFTLSGDWRDSFRAYFREMLSLAQRGDFDVLAHLDYPARYLPVYVPEVKVKAQMSDFASVYDISLYEPEIRPVLRALIDRGKGIEINTGSLRKRLPFTCPPQVVVNWYREMGGQHLTIGSDSHLSRDVGAGLDVAVRMARAAGFTQLTVYEARKPAFFPLVGV